MSMLIGNLSTRPFYNERLVSVVLGVLLIGVIIAAAISIGHAISLSSQYTALTSRVRHDESEAKTLKKVLSAVQNEASAEETNLLTSATREVESVVARRIFSWTALFNRIERTLPADVMVTAIRPDFFDDQTVSVSLDLVGRSVEAIDVFVENLEQSGGFTKLLIRQEELTDAGMYRANLFGHYLSETELSRNPSFLGNPNSIEAIIASLDDLGSSEGIR